MLDWIKENSKAFIVAVTFHIIFFGALLINWQMDKPKKIVLEQGDVIQVTSVDANSYDAEIKKIEEKKQARKNLEKKRQAREERRLKDLEEKKKQKKAEQVKRKKAAEAKKKKEAKKKADQEKARKLAKKKAADEQRKKEEAKRKEELKRKELKKEELKRKEVQKKAEERKKVEAEKRKKEEKKRQDAERKRKAEEEKKRQAELKRQEERANAERKRLSKGIINRHVSMIAQKIERNWRQPLDAPSNLKCKIDIVLLPSGNVVSVKVVETSGNPSFDRSVETAVRKASPLPVPTDSVIFKQFEVMRLRFEPGR